MGKMQQAYLVARKHKARRESQRRRWRAEIERFKRQVVYPPVWAAAWGVALGSVATATASCL